MIRGGERRKKETAGKLETLTLRNAQLSTRSFGLLAVGLQAASSATAQRSIVIPACTRAFTRMDETAEAFRHERGEARALSDVLQ